MASTSATSFFRSGAVVRSNAAVTSGRMRGATTRPFTFPGAPTAASCFPMRSRIASGAARSPSTELRSSPPFEANAAAASLRNPTSRIAHTSSSARAAARRQQIVALARIVFVRAERADLRAMRDEAFELRDACVRGRSNRFEPGWLRKDERGERAAVFDERHRVVEEHERTPARPARDGHGVARRLLDRIRRRNERRDRVADGLVQSARRAHAFGHGARHELFDGTTHVIGRSAARELDELVRRHCVVEFRRFAALARGHGLGRDPLLRRGLDRRELRDAPIEHLTLGADDLELPALARIGLARDERRERLGNRTAEEDGEAERLQISLVHFERAILVEEQFVVDADCTQNPPGSHGGARRQVARRRGTADRRARPRRARRRACPRSTAS